MPDHGLAPAVTLLVPGDVNLRTGGYGYDRAIIAGLRALGWTVHVLSLDGSFPYPTAAARAYAAQALAALPDGMLVLADGLAFGALADEAEGEAQRLRLVALVHHPLADETGVAPAAAAAFMASERRALSGTRGVVVTSPNTARRLADFAVPADRIAVVVPGTDAFPLSHGTRTPVELLCVATIVPRKGHDVLVAALTQLRDLPWHLTCGGSLALHPPSVAALRAQVHAGGLDDRVTLAGDLDAAALAHAYGRADVFVLATRHEGYGMVVAEAVACGLPVVSTATGAIPDLVDDRSGAIVPIDDPDALAAALRPLITDAAALARVTAGARARRDRVPRWPDAAQAMAGALTRLGANGILQR